MFTYVTAAYLLWAVQTLVVITSLEFRQEHEISNKFEFQVKSC